MTEPRRHVRRTVRSLIFQRLVDPFGEWLMRRELKRQYSEAERLRVKAEEHRVNNARYFDVDEDHCLCPAACEVH